MSTTPRGGRFLPGPARCVWRSGGSGVINEHRKLLALLFVSSTWAGVLPGPFAYILKDDAMGAIPSGDLSDFRGNAGGTGGCIEFSPDRSASRRPASRPQSVIQGRLARGWRAWGNSPLLPQVCRELRTGTAADWTPAPTVSDHLHRLWRVALQGNLAGDEKGWVVAVRVPSTQHPSR